LSTTLVREVAAESFVIEGGHPLGGHRREGRGSVEPVGEHDRGADPQRHPQAGVQPEDVAQRQRNVEHIGGPQQGRLDGGKLVDIGEQSPCRQHRALLAPAGARGVEQHRYCLAGPVGVWFVAVGRPREELVRGGRRDMQRRPGVREDVVDLRLRVRGIQRHGDQPGPQRTEVKHGERDAGGEFQGDPIALRRTGSPQCESGAADGAVEFAPCQPGCLVDDCGPRGIAAAARSDELRDADRPVRTHA